jgi:hypothetical protein
MILLLNLNPSSHIQNPKTNKQLILQKIVIPKGHNYSCSKRNNTKCPNLHKHVGMLRASRNCLNSKPRIQDRARAREREREIERARERGELRVLKCTTDFASFMYEGAMNAHMRNAARWWASIKSRTLRVSFRLCRHKCSSGDQNFAHPSPPLIYLPLLFGSWFLNEPSIPVLASFFFLFFN